MTKNNLLLDVDDLCKYFPIRRGLFRRTVGYVRAVDAISFQLREGETVGLIGESGCGKTTAGRCVLRTLEPTEGTIEFHENGRTMHVTELDSEELREYRVNAQMIFQDPHSSLNPRLSVFETIGEPLICHDRARGQELKDRVRELLDIVGLSEQHLFRYPHAFSGGQRQRIGIARALALNPSLIVADEPVAALDASISAQILNLLLDLQEEFELTYLFIAHDLSVVRHISNRVMVMYLGRIVEAAETDELFHNPLHPYTEALLSAVPKANPRRRDEERILLRGEVPDASDIPEGCRFAPRCNYAEDICREKEPDLKAYGGEHEASCHLVGELSLRGV